jgi:putative ATP-binding cassette transporter
VPAGLIAVSTEEGECGIAYDGLTLLSPEDGRILTKELNTTLACSMRLLVRGEDEEAKAALFRATAGTWESGEGRILRPGDEKVLFLSERPYLPTASLREVLTPSSHDRAIPEDRILATLRVLELEPLLERVGGMDVERRWDTVLSLAEQQQIAFVRVLLLAPSFVFLNRAGTALEPGQLRRVLLLFKERSIGVVTDGEGELAAEYFHAILDLTKDGRWTLKLPDAGPSDKA